MSFSTPLKIAALLALKLTMRVDASSFLPASSSADFSALTGAIVDHTNRRDHPHDERSLKNCSIVNHRDAWYDVCGTPPPGWKHIDANSANAHWIDFSGKRRNDLPEFVLVWVESVYPDLDEASIRFQGGQQFVLISRLFKTDYQINPSGAAPPLPHAARTNDNTEIIDPDMESTLVPQSTQKPKKSISLVDGRYRAGGSKKFYERIGGKWYTVTNTETQQYSKTPFSILPKRVKKETGIKPMKSNVDDAFITECHKLTRVSDAKFKGSAKTHRRLTAEEILDRRQRRTTSAEVVLGRLLEEIKRLQ